MHYHTDMMTHDMAFGEPVGGTGGSKLLEVSTTQIASELSKQAEQTWGKTPTF